MVKSTKNLVASSNSKKEPSKREISRKMDTYRKRLKRAKNRMETRIQNKEFKGEEKKAAEKYVKQIEHALEKSYVKKTKKGGYNYNLESFDEMTKTVQYRSKHEIYVQVDKRNEDTVQAHDQARESMDASGKLDIKKTIDDANRQMRQNLQFQREMSQARVSDGVSSLSDLEVSAFYRATQSIWQGESLINRNAAIMKELGVTSLEDAFYKVLNDPQVKEYLKTIKELSGNVKDTKKSMGGKDKDEEDWKYDNRIIGIISKNTIARRNGR